MLKRLDVGLGTGCGTGTGTGTGVVVNLAQMMLVPEVRGRRLALALTLVGGWAATAVADDCGLDLVELDAEIRCFRTRAVEAGD